MNKIGNKKRIISLSIIIYLFLYVIFYLFILVNKYLKYAGPISAAMLIGLCALTVALLGFRKDQINYIKKTIFKIIVIELLFYFCLIYALGLTFGFLKNAYSLNPLMIFNNMFIPLIVVITSEIMRYVIISNNKEGKLSKLIMVLLTMALIVLDISFSIRIDMFNSPIKIFKVLTTILLPSVAKNMMLSYLTYHVGIRQSLLYRLIMDLYIYIVPIFPDLGEYASSMLGILLPYMVYRYTSREIREYKVGPEYTYNFKLFNGSDLALLGLTVVLICLVSGFFPLYILGIASGSMSPEIGIGDAVLVKKVNLDSDISKGDVIVYEHNDLNIVHRVIIKEIGTDGKITYRTKGDANNSEDKIDLNIEDIKGKVLVKIPFIGYPSIWFSELIGN